jgi:hypothetical protein
MIADNWCVSMVTDDGLLPVVSDHRTFSMVANDGLIPMIANHGAMSMVPDDGIGQLRGTGERNRSGGEYGWDNSPC